MGGRRVKVAACTVAKDYPGFRWYALNVRAYQDLLIHSLIPFTFLIVCNIMILYKLLAEFQQRQSMTSIGNGNDKKDSEMNSLLAMLLTISFVHLICTIPLRASIIMDNSDPFGKPVLTEDQVNVLIRWSVAVSLINVNHSLNFILYSLSGQVFRKWVIEMFHLNQLCNWIFQMFGSGKCCKDDVEISIQRSTATAEGPTDIKDNIIDNSKTGNHIT